MRVLVTGASGYIGRLTLPRLAARGFDVHATARHSTGDAGVAWHQIDLLAPGAPEQLIGNIRPDVLLHLAWDVTPGIYWTAPANALWRTATAALARAFFLAGGQRFVGAGTCAEYDWSSGQCDERATPTLPATLYGQSKLGAWNDVSALADSLGRRAAWGRLFYQFGGDEHPSRLVPSVAMALLSGHPALCTHGEQQRNFLHVEDVADAFVTLVESDVVGPVNIVLGESHRVRDVIEGLAQRLGRPDLVRLGARETTEPLTLLARTDRLSGEVGWRPRWGFEESLDEAARYWRAKGG